MRGLLTRARWALPAGLSGVALALAVLCLWHRGFVGLSNDDAARTLVAWDQSRALTLDPTRSSWLPAHSWLLALALRLWPELLNAPRLISFTSAVVALFSTGRSISRTGARPFVQGAVLFALALWPMSVLSAASGGIPEMPCVALTTFALCVLYESSSVSAAAFAGVLLSIAEGHRYEAWWATWAIVAAYALDRRALRPTAALALCAMFTPIFWIALNAHRHGDPWEFVHRVEAFRRGEGGLPPVMSRVLRFPWIFATEASFFAILAPWGAYRAWRLRHRDLALRVLPALAVLGALVLGDLRGGGPTHHPARAVLLAVWMLGPIACEGLSSLLSASSAWRYALAGGLLAAQCRAQIQGESSVDAGTLRAGRALRSALERAPDAPWLITLDRQDFLWVEVLSAAPTRALADRPYGGRAPTRDALRLLSERVSVACVSEPDAVQTLVESGFRVTLREGGWSVLSRRGSKTISCRRPARRSRPDR